MSIMERQKGFERYSIVASLFCIFWFVAESKTKAPKKGATKMSWIKKGQTSRRILDTS